MTKFACAFGLALIAPTTVRDALLLILRAVHFLNPVESTESNSTPKDIQ